MPPHATTPATMQTALLRALYLTERRPGEPAETADWVEPLIRLWRQETGLRDDADLDRRLAADGLDRTGFERLVAGMDAPQRAPEAGLWWTDTLAEILTQADTAAEADRQRLFTTLRPVPFGLVLWPFVHWTWKALQRRLAAPDLHDVVASTDTLIGTLLRALTTQLAACTAPTMALELNIARLRQELTDDDPGQRFTAFLSRFTEPDQIRRLLEKYPVLGRLLATKTGYAVDAAIEALTRAAADLPALRTLTGAPLTRITSIGSTGSDAHRHGRQAMTFTFDDETVLVYKPRSLAVDALFQDLVTWANTIGVNPPLPVMRILDRGDHGWQEHITAHPCTTIAQVRSFYRRQGGFLALLYTLGAADLHRENLIAAGENPYPVDLETLFHSHDGPRTPESATYRTYRIAKDSVLATGLLPFFVSDAEGTTATDLSGFGGSGGQATMTEVRQWTGIGTDRMHAGRGHLIIEDAANRPVLDGAPARAEDHADDILAGFRHTYDLLTAYRDTLATRLRAFTDVPVRYVIRGTHLYSLAREAGHHPDYLGNGLHRDRLLDRFWAGLSGLPGIEPIVQAERTDLLCDDVPYFHTRPGSNDLWDSRDQRIAGYFTVTGLEIATARVDRLGPHDRERQSELISIALGAGTRPHLHVTSTPTTPDSTLPERFLAAATQIGDRLLNTAVWGTDRRDASWLEPRWMGKDRWQLGPADVGLYAGLPGIALFLAYLADATGDARYRDTSTAAVASMTEMLDAPLGGANASAFLGRGSAVYLYTHLSALYRDPAYLDQALRQADRVSSIDPTGEVDLLDGAAGTILVLLRLHRATGEQRPLEIAIRYGEHLARRAETLPTGVGWRSAVSGAPLAGLSHGAAGICWALAELAESCGRQQFLDLARAGVAYERTLFDPDRGNWLDLRRPDTPETVLPVSWCNGATGIGLARLAGSRLLHDEHTDAEIEIAVQTTIDKGFRQNESLCHGDLGNLELLLAAAEHDHRRHELKDLAYQRAEQSYAAAQRRGRWLSGWGSKRDEVSGLMTGLAGTGLTLLRLATDLRVPTPVTLGVPAHETHAIS